MSVWGTTDPSGLSGDTQQTLPFDPFGGAQAGETFPGGFPTADVGQQIANLTGAEAGPNAIGPSPDLQPSSSSGGLMALLSSLFSGGSSTSTGLGGIGSGSKIGSLISSLLGPSLGLNQSGAGATGGEVGGLVGGAAGSILGPGGTLAGSAIGDLLGSLVGNWVGGGLNKEAKPQALVGSLETSGNPVEELLGKYITTSGINQGYDLSESGKVPFNPTREADVLQLLTGEALPNSVTAGGFQNNPTLKGWKNLAELKGLMPNATNLNLNQIQQIMPLIAHLVNKSGNENLTSLLGQENTLAQKLRAAETY